MAQVDPSLRLRGCDLAPEPIEAQGPVRTDGGQIAIVGEFLLTHRLGCGGSLVGTPPYRIGEEFDPDFEESPML